MPSPRNQSRKAIAADREKRALALRLAGATYEQIASELHISLGAAHKAVQSVLDRTRQQCSEQADELRQLEVARLDRMLLLLESQIRTGHLGAIDRALRIQERRAKLLGLDAPVRQEVAGFGGKRLTVDVQELSDEQIDAELSRLANIK